MAGGSSGHCLRRINYWAVTGSPKSTGCNYGLRDRWKVAHNARLAPASNDTGNQIRLIAGHDVCHEVSISTTFWSTLFTCFNDELEHWLPVNILRALLHFVYQRYHSKRHNAVQQNHLTALWETVNNWLTWMCYCLFWYTCDNTSHSILM